MASILVENKKTGMTVSVPEEKLQQFQDNQRQDRELSPEAKEKFDRAWQRAMERLYGK